MVLSRLSLRTKGCPRCVCVHRAAGQRSPAERGGSGGLPAGLQGPGCGEREERSQRDEKCKVTSNFLNFQRAPLPAGTKTVLIKLLLPSGFPGDPPRRNGGSGPAARLVRPLRPGRERHLQADGALRHRGALHHVRRSPSTPQYPPCACVRACVRACLLPSLTSAQSSPWWSTAAGTSVSAAAAPSWM